MLAILYNIRSLHNVGSIFRTADAAGFKKIYLCGITPGPRDIFGRLRPQIAKTALGAQNYIAWDDNAKTLKQTLILIEKLKKEKYTIFAVEQSKKSIAYSKIKKAKKTALIMGNEVKGLPPSILKAADQIIEIPMQGKKESLNVSVAFGVVAFELASKK